MTPRPSLIGQLSRHKWIGNDTLRRTVLVVLILICAVLTLFPQKYRAAVTVAPTDPSTLGLGGTLGQLGAGASVFGNQAAIDMSLKMAGSLYVRRDVSRDLDLPRVLGKSETRSIRWLNSKVKVRSLRGGFIQIEYNDTDQDFALRLIQSYTTAVRKELAVISQNQTSYKRKILQSLVDQSRRDLAAADDAYNQFRSRTKYGSPEDAIETVSSRVPMLETQILAKKAEINALSKFATDFNIQVRRAEADLVELQRQLEEAKATERSAGGGGLGDVIEQSTELDRRMRDLALAKQLYYSYKRYLQGTVVENLTSTANIRILEPPFIDPERQLNLLALAAGLSLALVGLAIEFYRLRPPVGDQAPA